MGATTYYADNYKANPTYSASQVGLTVTREFEFTITAAFVLDDLLKLAIIPAGIILCDYFVDVPDLDTSTGIVLDLGDDDDDDHFILGSTVGQAVGFLAPMITGGVKGRLPKKYTAANNLVLHIDTAATGTAATSGTIKGWMRYFFYGNTSL